MECRTSLFYTPPVQEHSVCEKVRGEEILTWSNSRRYTRSSPRPPSPPVKKKQEQIPLPLPKNLLLITLMEMAQMEAAAKRITTPTKTKKKKHKQPTQIQYHQKNHNNKEKSFTSEELLQLRTVASNASESSTEVLLTGKIMPEEIAPMELSYSQNKADSYDEDGYDVSSSEDENEIDDDFDDDDDRMITAVGAFSSTCGTYAVAEKNGLLVLPRKPKDVTEADYTSHIKTSSSTASSTAPLTPPKNIVSSPSKFASTGRRLSWKLSRKKSSQENSPSSTVADTDIPLQQPPSLLQRTYSNPPLPYELEYGAKVQVVSIEDGWVTLARNKGFLYVDNLQLVKVGGPEDRACEIEGMLVSINQTRKEMEKRKELLKIVESNLVEKLHKSLQKAAPTVVLPTHDNDWKNISNQEEEMKQQKKRLDALHLASPKPAKPPSEQMPRLSGLQIDTSNEAVDHLTLPHLSPSQTSTAPPHSPLRMSISSSSYRSPGRPTYKPQSPATVSSGSRRRSMPSPVSPNGSKRVDFRTGLSGHHALSSSKTHSRFGGMNRPAIRMMGEHRGLGGTTWNLLRRLGSSDANDTSTGSNSSGRTNILCMSQTASSSIPEGDS